MEKGDFWRTHVDESLTEPVTRLQGDSNTIDFWNPLGTQTIPRFSMIPLIGSQYI